MTTKPNHNSLKRKLAKVGKLPVDELAGRSQFNIDLMKDEFEVVMRNQIEELTDLMQGKDPASIRGIYEISSQIISSASFVKADWVSRAAQSLCEVHEIMSAGKWDWEAISVHGKTIQLLASLEPTQEAMSQSLLEGLGAVVAAKRA
ncbi:hypothetical protein [Aquidulcibacter sp.]|jgi:hypothetical protein|uniref:hypothetical protein n=1 Tax=Aquidulcibacter sp. TaxID=2052990 RepID=UPI00078BC5B3|nr:hypothetical protein AEM38_11750 [Hyphomonadaceae bacterium UKL13-1]OYU53402.1 MAG: hypothetical protein CFE27_00540 [Alphaproteobacteria bacterium PA1]HCP66064.1 hypothetical protein [Hyphomonadaceae bacterium]